MTAIELLQNIGLNKYEAEAYYALLAEGPLTGYELGKRSGVPLSRSYEVLERLAQRGLALVQPGEPPRYAAAEAAGFLSQVQASFAETVGALATALAALPHRNTAAEFWVLRGRSAILARATSMIDAARQAIELSLPADGSGAVIDALAAARLRGCRVLRLAVPEGTETIMLLVDGREALVGTLAPADRCQAVVTGNPALVAAVGGYFAHRSPGAAPSAPESSVVAEQRRVDWIDWEERKQRRLRQQAGGRVA
jgi:sugar-specific transcriptional regulator TrmB